MNRAVYTIPGVTTSAHVKIYLRAQKVLDEVAGVISQSNVTQWEVSFLKNLVDQRISLGSEKQVQILNRIEDKVFGAEDSHA